MSSVTTPKLAAFVGLQIRVRGLVQGVGFRPFVWRLAQHHHLHGQVNNDGEGVTILVIGQPESLQHFLTQLREQPPILARIDEIVSEPLVFEAVPPDFTIEDSREGHISTAVIPDAAACAECVREVLDPFARRFRYPFATCTHCGPRLTIQEHIPYDRTGTTMRDFPLCPACSAEYHDPADRRFHAQPIACDHCGPRAWLERTDWSPITIDAFSRLDAVNAACTIIQRGHITAIKGLGGFQLACDATQETVVARLRQLKGREAKPFALMVRDLQIIERYATVTESERALLESPAAPIVLLSAKSGTHLAPSVAPGMRTLGFMLPNTPLHHLLMRRMDRPIVLTSGNRSDEPQWTDLKPAKIHLGDMAEYWLTHNRPIAHRVDDSVARVIAGTPRILRRSRGYAPAPIPLPKGFENAPHVLAMGGELKNTFGFIRNGHAVVSHHIGDLGDALTHADYHRALSQYANLFAHVPTVIAVDRHPDYHSSKAGRARAETQAQSLCEVQHHHAHVAACLAEHGVPIDHAPVLGVILDGLGYGENEEFWGGEFLLADYRTATRVGTFKPVAMLGGEQAIKEPWRNTYAHLMAELGWAQFAMNYADLDLYRFLEQQPRSLLDGMLSRGLNSPLASSCGRLFDAVAAAIGLSRERASYEGQAAMELEQLVDHATLEQEDETQAYPFSIHRLKGTRLPYIEPLAMWHALLGDLKLQTPPAIMAARFHKGLANALCTMIDTLTKNDTGERTIRTIVLSGGVFQNRVLHELVTSRLEQRGFTVLAHARVPTNDGGLSLGQAVVAAARTLHPSA